MIRYDTIVFDLDGTLLDTLEDLSLSLGHALASQGLPVRAHEEVRALVGNGMRRLVADAVPANTPARVEEAVFAEFNRHYAAHCNDHARPYPDTPELVRRLHDEGRHVAVVSNKGDHAVRILMDAHFPDALDAVVGVRGGVARKPDRAMVDAALAEMGPAAQDDARGGRAVYVGDSEVDLLTARNAGLPCISVSWGFRGEGRLRAAGATAIVEDVDELATRLG